jgi:hypothetical protein
MKGGFWWRASLKLLGKFKSFAVVQINNDQSCLLWEDLWLDEPVKQKFPELFSFTKDRHITIISKAKSQGQLTQTLSFATVSCGFLPNSRSLHYY